MLYVLSGNQVFGPVRQLASKCSWILPDFVNLLLLYHAFNLIYHSLVLRVLCLRKSVYFFFSNRWNNFHIELNVKLSLHDLQVIITPSTPPTHSTGHYHTIRAVCKILWLALVSNSSPRASLFCKTVIHATRLYWKHVILIFVLHVLHSRKKSLCLKVLHSYCMNFRKTKVCLCLSTFCLFLNQSLLRLDLLLESNNQTC